MPLGDRKGLIIETLQNKMDKTNIMTSTHSQDQTSLIRNFRMKKPEALCYPLSTRRSDSLIKLDGYTR